MWHSAVIHLLEKWGPLSVSVTFWAPPQRAVTLPCWRSLFMARLSWMLAFGLTVCNEILCPNAWEHSAALWYPHSFCDARNPETMLSNPGFCLSSTPSGKLVKVPILHSTAYTIIWYLNNGGFNAHGLSSDRWPHIHFSIHPPLQKVVVFLFIEL